MPNSTLQTVSNVDLVRYAGKWYEIASFPNSFQKGCSCTTAEYEATEKGFIKVINTCKRNGEVTRIEGKAFVVKNSSNAKLKVQFFWPFKGDYWIIDLDTNYNYAVVGNPSRKYLWILSREKNMNDETFNSIVKRISEKGFDTSKLVKTTHSCN